MGVALVFQHCYVVFLLLILRFLVTVTAFDLALDFVLLVEHSVFCLDNIHVRRSGNRVLDIR